MTALEQLNAYVRRLELRLRLLAASRGIAFVASFTLALTLLMVFLSNRYQFAHGIVLATRIVLYLELAAAVSLALLIPLLKVTRRHVTRLAEKRIPDLQERLLTATERPDPANPFTELIAEDALRVAQLHQPEEIVSSASLFSLFGVGALAAAALLWLIAAGPGYWGYGASLLWTGHGSVNKRPLYDVAVQPGNKTIRRKSDQLVTAQTFGFSPGKVTLYAKPEGALKWEQTSMQPKTDGSGYQFLFAGLSNAVEYYVRADSAQSKHFTINVKDLPGVKRVRVQLHFPSGLGLEDVSEDPGGDIRAVQGTEAAVSVLTDRPLEHGILVMDDGARVELARGDGNWLKAQLRIQKDGSYHVAALDAGEAVRISDDYFIEAKKDEPPSVKILKPGRDPHVSPIEEVPVTVEAADDFGVKNLELHYSVNGGPEQTVPLSSGKRVKEAEGKTTLAFENFKVVPGDVVSFYATARDANTTAQSDMIFAQAEPFDFKFSQSQQAGGMGGGMNMNSQENISERQKQIIAATFNQVRDATKDRAALQEHARFLSELESKLGAQAKTLADRMASRELGSANSQFEDFSKFMTQASSQMDDAVSDLKPGKWHDALPPEQKALQSLLRAEALFRDIQVAFGQQGGGGGGSGAQRDLARMFDLELDTSKNQYETGQSAAASAEKDQQKAIDEAFEKLQMLAKRQQELANENAQQQAFQQRWQEEQLRREAEELRQQMQQLAQNSQGQQQQSSQSGQQGQQSNSSSSQSSSSQSGSSQSGSSQSSSQSGRQSGQSAAAQGQQSRQNEQMAQALRQATGALERAEDQMRKAVSEHDSTAQQRAAAQLREAQDLLKNMMHQQAGSSVSDLAQRAQQIAAAQKGLADRMKQMYGDQDSNAARRPRPFEMSSESSSGSDDGMAEMNDPDSVRFGYGFRRRNWQQELMPRREPTEQEKEIADHKEKLGQELEQLQKGIQQQAQAMAGGQPDASSKLRKALSDAEQKELALRMQKDAEWMREGYGDRNLGMEDGVTAGVEQLSQRLRDVQKGVDSGNANSGKDAGEKNAQALSRVRALREELERRSEQSGEGSAEGANQQSGQSGGAGPALSRNDIQDAVNQLNSIRGRLDPQDRALAGYINGVIGTMQHLTGAQDGLLDSRINRAAIVSLERLEVELNKRAVKQESEGARTGAPEATPEQYRDAVAEYFKKLSK